MSAKSIYVHIPFCIKICSYCDFTKFLYHHSYVEPYINSLVNQIDSYGPFDAYSIYLGGGTPSCLPNSLLIKVLDSLSNFTNKVKEYTIETNVENIDIELINTMKKYGINRISIGVQTFNDTHLKEINRNHNYLQIIEKINLLIENEIDNISIDLIYGLPNQTFDEWKDDLEKAIALPIKHISIYSLMIEEHTMFFNKNIKEQDEDFLELCYTYAYKYLKENGFNRYEVSNFAKASVFESKHNLVYWNDLEYVGFGVGASGYEGNIRYTNTKSLTDFIKDNTLRVEETITFKDHLEEYIMLHLRISYGFSINEINNIFKINFKDKFKKVLDKLIDNNLIEIIDNDIVRVKEDKLYILNQIIVEFLEEIE